MRVKHQAIETRHHALPLATLAAFIEAREADTQPAVRSRRAVPRATAQERGAPAGTLLRKFCLITVGVSDACAVAKISCNDG
jgi:hypothetical protein